MRCRCASATQPLPQRGLAWAYTGAGIVGVGGGCWQLYATVVLGLNALQDWSDKWLLKLNIFKCKTVFFGRNINKNYTYSVQGTQLERLEHMKGLGVIFDSELNFMQHCKEKIYTAYSYFY